MKLFILTFSFFCLSVGSYAQDLNARVQIVSPKIQSTNKRAFQTLETAVKEFLNSRKWSADVILPKESIDCNFILNITSWDGSSTYGGELQVQSSRPVFNSSYSSTLLNTNDKDISFTYTEGQALEYSDQNFQNNLSSILAFYAYIIVGIDYDSFSRYGGNPYFTIAQTLVTNAQSASYTGWKAFDGSTNRYWLIENLTNKIYQPLRGFIYDYHRNGLDVMADNRTKALKTIIDNLPILAQLDRQRQGAMFPLIFFTSKSDELVSILSKADPQDKIKAMNLLSQIDPSNGLKYKNLQKN
jgi:hypothetical protein